MKSELRRDTHMLHPNFIMCWKRPHFHWAVFEGGLACVLSWDGSVFVLLNSLTPPGPVSSSLTTAAPWVREWRERLRSDGGLNPIPLLAARCIVFEGVACLLWRKMARDHALCSPGIQSTEKSFLNPKEYLIHNVFIQESTVNWHSTTFSGLKFSAFSKFWRIFFWTLEKTCSICKLSSECTLAYC